MNNIFNKLKFYNSGGQSAAARRVRQLEEENKKLRRQIKELKNQASGTHAAGTDAEDTGGAAAQELARRGNSSRLYATRTYPSYLYKSLKGTSAWNVSNKFFAYSRRFRLLNTVFRTVTLITVWVQASAALLVIYTAVIISIPVLFLSSMLISVVGMTQYRKNNKILREKFGGERVYVLFADKKSLRNQNSYLRTMVSELSAEAGRSVVIVSPYFWNPCGTGGKKYYFCMRNESERAYIVRRHYFFSLRRNVLRGSAAYIY